MSITADCTAALCEAMPECVTCGRRKAPRGRLPLRAACVAARGRAAARSCGRATPTTTPGAVRRSRPSATRLALGPPRRTASDPQVARVAVRAHVPGMSLIMLLLVVLLIFAIIGAIPNFGYNRHVSGVLAVVLLVVIVLYLTGHIGHVGSLRFSR